MPNFPDVNGTVASHKDPMTIENIVTVIGVVGNKMKINNCFNV